MDTKTRYTDESLMAAVRTLDPAAPAGDEAPSSSREVLDRVLAAPRHGGTDAVVVPRRPKAGHVPRWGLAAASVVGLGVAFALLPGPTDHSAFAGWTAVPAVLSAADAERIGERCVSTVSERAAGESASTDEETARWAAEWLAGVDTLRMIAVERRGEYELVVLTGPLQHLRCVHRQDGTLLMLSLQSGGSVQSPPAHGIGAIDYFRTGSHVWEDVMLVAQVGGGVADVDLRPLGGDDAPGLVHATTTNGYVLAWWPGERPEDIAITLHLTDGTRVETTYLAELERQVTGS